MLEYLSVLRPLSEFLNYVDLGQLNCVSKSVSKSVKQLNYNKKSQIHTSIFLLKNGYFHLHSIKYPNYLKNHPSGFSDILTDPEAFFFFTPPRSLLDFEIQLKYVYSINSWTTYFNLFHLMENHTFLNWYKNMFGSYIGRGCITPTDIITDPTSGEWKIMVIVFARLGKLEKVFSVPEYNTPEFKLKAFWRCFEHSFRSKGCWGCSMCFHEFIPQLSKIPIDSDFIELLKKEKRFMFMWRMFPKIFDCFTSPEHPNHKKVSTAWFCNALYNNDTIQAIKLMKVAMDSRKTLEYYQQYKRIFYVPFLYRPFSDELTDALIQHITSLPGEPKKQSFDWTKSIDTPISEQRIKLLLTCYHINSNQIDKWLLACLKTNDMQTFRYIILTFKPNLAEFTSGLSYAHFHFLGLFLGEIANNIHIYTFINVDTFTRTVLKESFEHRSVDVISLFVEKFWKPLKGDELIPIHTIKPNFHNRRMSDDNIPLLISFLESHGYFDKKENFCQLIQYFPNQFYTVDGSLYNHFISKNLEFTAFFKHVNL